MRQQFRDTVMNLAVSDPDIVLIFGDVSVYLFKEFQDKYPDRFYNLGICENTLISASAGLSSQGLIPFVHSINPFMTERSLEQIKLDMCYNNFGGNIVTCGASFDYAWDGATHHSYTDIAILRLLPGIEIIQPGSKNELDALLRTQYNNGRTTYFRLSDHPHKIEMDVEFGKALTIRDEGAPLTIMTAGPLLDNVKQACEKLDVNLVYFHTIKPVDRDTIEHFRDTNILVVHDAFGLHEAINEVPGLNTEYHGLPDRFLSYYGKLDDIRGELGLDREGIKQAITNKLGRIKN